MISLELSDIEIALKDRSVRKALIKGLGLPKDSSLKKLRKVDPDELSDAVLYILEGEFVVEEVEAEQDKGAYTISVYGIAGLYLVNAPERDLAGPFKTRKEALEHVYGDYGDFLT